MKQALIVCWSGAITIRLAIIMRRILLIPSLLTVAVSGCANPVTVVDVRFVDDASIMMEFSEPLSAPGGARSSSFRLSLTTAVQLTDLEAQTTVSETQYDLVHSPEKTACLAACDADDAATDCDECEALPAELEVEAVRYGSVLDRIHLDLAEPPSVIDCADLELTRSSLRKDAQDRGLTGRIEVGFMVHYAGELGSLRFDEGRTLADQGGTWVTERDAEAGSSRRLVDGFFGEFDVQETLGCYED